MADSAVAACLPFPQLAALFEFKVLKFRDNCHRLAGTPLAILSSVMTFILGTIMAEYDAILGMHARALQVRAKRSQVLANNLVNSNTPHFKAKDLDFKQVLQDTKNLQGQLSMSRTRDNHILAQSTRIDVPLRQREGLQASKDGNTVDAEIEKVMITKNNLQYQYELEKVDGTIKSLRLAIQGE